MGCAVIVSNTEPVTEIIQHQHNGLLTDFFDPKALADKVTEMLRNPGEYQTLRQNARSTIQQKLDLKSICLKKQAEMFRSVMEVSYAMQ